MSPQRKEKKKRTVARTKYVVRDEGCVGLADCYLDVPQGVGFRFLMEGNNTMQCENAPIAVIYVSAFVDRVGTV